MFWSGATIKKESERKERLRKKNDDNIVRLESENTEQQKEKFIQIHIAAILQLPHKNILFSDLILVYFRCF